MKNLLIQLMLIVLSFTSGLSQEFILEASLIVQQMSGDHTFSDTDTDPFKIEIESFTGYGLQTGVNMGKFNLGLDFIFGRSMVSSKHSFNASISCFDINVEYSLLRKPITPLLIAGIGSVNYSDSFTKVENLSEIDFSYNFGAGAKWIIAKKYFIKPTYRATFSKIKDTTTGIIFHGISVAVGYIFLPKKLI